MSQLISGVGGSPQSRLRRIQDLELTGKRVFLRLDLNVPIEEGVVTDTTRIDEALPTLKYVLERTGKLAICSHLGRPKGKPTPKYSLEPVGRLLAEKLGVEVVLLQDFQETPPIDMLKQLRSGQILLIENLRFNPGEESNDAEFAAHLVDGFDLYINDAFGTVHRAHASVEAAALRFPMERRAAGLLIQKEVEALGRIMAQPKTPFVVVMGGAKVSDKISVILQLLGRCTDLVIGGAMAYTFLQYKGIKVGTSRVESDKMSLVEAIFRNAETRRVTVHLPVDHVVAREFAETAPALVTEGPEIGDGMMGLDIGPKTRAAFAGVIGRANTVFWNGPMGVFEWDAFAAGTLAIAKAIASNRNTTIVGGGDSVSAANKAGVAAQMTHVSTGGGASLEFLEGLPLPGLKVLTERLPLS